MLTSLILILVIEYERYLEYIGASSPFDIIIPYRYGSKLWGKLANVEIPVWLRGPIYRTYAKVFGANLEEMALPVESYTCLGDFFARPLKSGILAAV